MQTSVEVVCHKQSVLLLEFAGFIRVRTAATAEGVALATSVLIVEAEFDLTITALKFRDLYVFGPWGKFNVGLLDWGRGKYSRKNGGKEDERRERELHDCWQWEASKGSLRRLIRTLRCPSQRGNRAQFMASVPSVGA